MQRSALAAAAQRPVEPLPVLPVLPLLGLEPVELLLPLLLLDAGESAPGELESGTISVPVVLSFGRLLPMVALSPVPVPLLSALFALLASFAGRSWLHATRAKPKPKIETSTATCGRAICFLS